MSRTDASKIKMWKSYKASLDQMAHADMDLWEVRILFLLLRGEDKNQAEVCRDLDATEGQAATVGKKIKGLALRHLLENVPAKGKQQRWKITEQGKDAIISFIPD